MGMKNAKFVRPGTARATAINEEKTRGGCLLIKISIKEPTPRGESIPRRKAPTDIYKTNRKRGIISQKRLTRENQNQPLRGVSSAETQKAESMGRSCGKKKEGVGTDLK